jgi:hypothetical protein
MGDLAPIFPGEFFPSCLSKINMFPSFDNGHPPTAVRIVRK